MSMFHLIFFTWVLLSVSCFLITIIIGSASASASGSSCLHDFVQQSNQQFVQKTNQFWELNEETNTWVEVKLPYDLLSCVDDTCTKVGSLADQKTQNPRKERENQDALMHEKWSSRVKDEGDHMVFLPARRRVSLTKMSEASVWVTGVSGSIYERYWNGVQWVIAPHDLPLSAGPAVNVFIVNQTILALSEAGLLYQIQLTENSQPQWVEFMPAVDQISRNQEAEQHPAFHIKSGAVSHNGQSIYFCTKNGALLELIEIEPPRWVNHGKPPGANVAAIADAASIRPQVIYTVSSTGGLYEYDRNSKPSWKKHIWSKGSSANVSLIPAMGSTLRGLAGDHSVSLFLLTKGGFLVERRIKQRKWKWMVHGSPNDHNLTSITPIVQDESNEKFFSMLFTTSVGIVFEYRLPKESGSAQGKQTSEEWISHMHPQHAKAARGIPGLSFQFGRTIFALDDGRLAELHLSGIGGENSGPTTQHNIRRKSPLKYIWSILDAPESEGWNAGYCTEERGPMNCITGIKDEPNNSGFTKTARRRKGVQVKHDYLLPKSENPVTEEYRLHDNWINSNFRLRVMHNGRSFFLITDGGLTFEYLYTENIWLWLRHEHSTPMKGALGSYNGSLYMVDMYGSLIIRERSSNQLDWINCTAMMRKGRQVIGGSPWEAMPGNKAMKVTAEDALFFISRNGRLLQFRVSLRKFKWKDCRYPQNTKIACIVDQELFRENIVFVVGRNGRLYQYNKVTELWHEHYQSPHLVLSIAPGTAMRPPSESLSGSLFMLSRNGGLVEYHWNMHDGWNWVEHGAPDKGVTLVGAPGPCFGGSQLLLIGSDGKVYIRYIDQMTWKWRNCGFPYIRKEERKFQNKDTMKDACMDYEFAASFEKEADEINLHKKNCEPKVAGTRPIPFSEDTVIFELRDGRLAEMRRVEEKHWLWTRTIATPTSSCVADYWTAFTS